MINWPELDPHQSFFGHSKKHGNIRKIKKKKEKEKEKEKEK
jgi:hypothetical protein